MVQALKRNDLLPCRRKYESGQKMQFTANNTTDQIGIHYFGLRITRDLGHICRLNTGPDVGIDATIELVDSQRAATGAYVAVQIKTTRAEDNKDEFIRYFDEQHREYWIDHRVPVVFAVVNPDQEKIWLKHVASHTIERAEKSWKISFSAADEIKQNGQNLLMKLAKPDEADGVMRRLSAVKSTLQNINVIPLSLDDIGNNLDVLEDMRSELAIITQIVDTDPHRYGHIVRKELNSLKVRRARLDSEHSYQRNVEINGM